MPDAPADLIVMPAVPRDDPEGVAAFTAARPRLVLLDGEVVFET